MNVGKFQVVKAELYLPHTPKKLFPIRPSLNLEMPIANFNEDTISISDEAMELFAEENDFMNIEEEISQFKEMLKQLRESNDEDNPSIELKCLKIAMCIMGGDNVPAKDEAFLFEHDPQMYSMALLLRRAKDDPKNHKSILGDDNNDNMVDEAPMSAEIPSASQPSESVSVDSVETEGE